MSSRQPRKLLLPSKPKVLVVVATHDHVVTPGPAGEFAKMLGAELLELDSHRPGQVSRHSPWGSR
jgi:Mg-chelatase subunit ChlD